MELSAVLPCLGRPRVEIVCQVLYMDTLQGLLRSFDSMNRQGDVRPLPPKLLRREVGEKLPAEVIQWNESPAVELGH